MLTETVAGRTYNFSHSVGRNAQTGMGFNTPVAAAIGADGVVYVVNRGSESISNVGWNRTGPGRCGICTWNKQQNNKGEDQYHGGSIISWNDLWRQLPRRGCCRQPDDATRHGRAHHL